MGLALALFGAMASADTGGDHYAAAVATLGQLQGSSKLAVVTELEKAVAADPGNPDYHEALAYVSALQMEMRAKRGAPRSDPARVLQMKPAQEYRAAIKLRPQEPRYRFLLGLFALSQADPAKPAPAEAIASLREAARLDPDNAVPALALAAGLYRGEDDAAAYAQFRQAMARPRFVTYLPAIVAELANPQPAPLFEPEDVLGAPLVWVDLSKANGDFARRQAGVDPRQAPAMARLNVTFAQRLLSLPPQSWLSLSAAVEQIKGALDAQEKACRAAGALAEADAAARQRRIVATFQSDIQKRPRDVIGPETKPVSGALVRMMIAGLAGFIGATAWIILSAVMIIKARRGGVSKRLRTVWVLLALLTIVCFLITGQTWRWLGGEAGAAAQRRARGEQKGMIGRESGHLLHRLTLPEDTAGWRIDPK